jgi:hypothetical protein
VIACERGKSLPRPEFSGISPEFRQNRQKLRQIAAVERIGVSQTTKTHFSNSGNVIWLCRLAKTARLKNPWPNSLAKTARSKYYFFSFFSGNKT